MSNPTTPFGWQMPTNTDLVTDLPADFEVFGQAVATSMADLLGGTTGQYLAKNSATDMDFVWVTDAAGDITGVTAGTGISGGGTSGTVTVTNSMATAITTNGDIIYGTGSGTFNRLGIGTTGQVLTVAGGVPTYATPTSGSLTLISTTSLSGASVTLSSIPATYKHLQLVISGVTNATADGAFRIAPNGATTSSNNTLLNGSALEARLANYLLLVGPGGGFILTRTDANNVFVLNIYNYAATTMYKNFNSVGIATLTAVAGTPINTTGSYLANTAITSLVISNSGGNLSTGTVLLYGVN